MRQRQRRGGCKQLRRRKRKCTPALQMERNCKRGMTAKTAPQQKSAMTKIVLKRTSILNSDRCKQTVKATVKSKTTNRLTQNQRIHLNIIKVKTQSYATTAACVDRKQHRHSKRKLPPALHMECNCKWEMTAETSARNRKNAISESDSGTAKGQNNN